MCNRVDWECVCARRCLMSSTAKLIGAGLRDVPLINWLKLVWETVWHLRVFNKFNKWMNRNANVRAQVSCGCSSWSDRSLVAVKSLSIKFVRFNRFRLNEWHPNCFGTICECFDLSNCPTGRLAGLPIVEWHNRYGWTMSVNGSTYGSHSICEKCQFNERDRLRRWPFCAQIERYKKNSS